MPLKLPDDAVRPDETRTLAIGDAEMTLTVRWPEFDASFRIDAYDDDVKLFWQKFSLVVVGWDVTTPAGEPIPLTRQNVERLCLHYPQLVLALHNLVARMFYQQEDDVLKNWPLPPLVGGTEPNVVIDPSILSTDCGDDSKTETNVENVSAATSTD